MTTHLNPNKLNVEFLAGVTPDGPISPRRYTLTHSDMTGDLFLTVGLDYNRSQISGWYTRFMRDEVLAEWVKEQETPALHVHCHVSGGLVLGTARWRDGIFRYHLPMVLEAFRFGDQRLFEEQPALDQSPVRVHFNATRRRYHRVEQWGTLGDYQGPVHTHTQRGQESD
jgi:hypothetical protein